MILIRSFAFLFISSLHLAAMAPYVDATGMIEVENPPPPTRRLGDEFYRRGTCCNYSSETVWVLLNKGDGKGCFWEQLGYGKCIGSWSSNIDCEGMTCGGGFYKVGGVLGGQCVTPGQDSWPFTGRRWTPIPGCKDPGAEGPEDRCGEGFTDLPPGYPWGPRPMQNCPPVLSTTMVVPDPEPPVTTTEGPPSSIGTTESISTTEDPPSQVTTTEDPLLTEDPQSSIGTTESISTTEDPPNQVTTTEDPQLPATMTEDVHYETSYWWN